MIASAKAVASMDRSIWIAIYAGLLMIVLGFVTGEVHVAAGWSLGVLGAIAVAAGVVLIFVRSRVSEIAQPGAQSSSPPQEET